MIEHELATLHGPHRSHNGGIATILLLFAMCAFAVLSFAALSTALGGAAVGQTFSIFRSIPQNALTKFVADFVVPNHWKAASETGSFQFQLPVIVPETDGDDTSASAAWHVMTEVPGMAVCCEGRAGVCLQRNEGTGGARIADWNPGSDDAMWLSFELTSQPDTNSTAKGDMVTATVTSSPASTAADGPSVSCQLEFNEAVIARGTAVLRQIPRDSDSGLATPVVAGTMTVAVKTK